MTARFDRNGYWTTESDPPPGLHRPFVAPPFDPPPLPPYRPDRWPIEPMESDLGRELYIRAVIFGAIFWAVLIVITCLAILF